MSFCNFFRNSLFLSALILPGCNSLRPKMSENACQAWDSVKIMESQLIDDMPFFTFNGTYTLPALLELGIVKNPETRVAWWQARKALAQEGRTSSQFYPSISSEVDVGRKQTGAVLGSKTSKIDQWGPSLNVSYRLFQFGAGIADAKRAACALEAANYNFNFSLQTLVFNIQSAYYNYASAVASIEACESSLKDAEASFEVVQNKLSNGLARIQDVLLAKADKLQAEHALQAAQAALESCRAELALVVGVPISADFRIDVEFRETEDLVDEVSDLMEEALKQRADLLASAATAEAADWANLKTKRESLPSVNLLGNVGVLRYRNDSHWQRNYGIGIGIAWTLFDGFDREYKALESYAVLKEQKYLFHQQQLQVLRDVWSTFYAFQSSSKMLNSAKALEAAAKESLEAIRVGYDAGLNNLLDLLSAQKTLAEARLTRIRAQSDLAVNWAKLAYVSGRLDTSKF